jgi:hypothetical protein
MRFGWTDTDLFPLAMITFSIFRGNLVRKLLKNTFRLNFNCHFSRNFDDQCFKLPRHFSAFFHSNAVFQNLSPKPPPRSPTESRRGKVFFIPSFFRFSRCCALIPWGCGVSDKFVNTALLWKNAEKCRGNLKHWSSKFQFRNFLRSSR